MHTSSYPKMSDAIPRDLPVIVLVTVTNREALHQARTIPSLRQQSLQWDGLVIVDDTQPYDAGVLKSFADANLPQYYPMRNNGAHGAASAWNLGLKFIRRHWGDAWVAILDDDDLWAPEHLQTCHTLASNTTDAVISGIQTCKNGILSPCVNHGTYTISQFLQGNPGWQGSNTFVRLSKLEEAGCFDETLPCTHDRDLAIRLLSLSSFQHIRTGAVTVRYMLDEDLPAYTRWRNPVKLAGLRQFLTKHRHRMNSNDYELFLQRASQAFGFTFDEFQS